MRKGQKTTEVAAKTAQPGTSNDSDSESVLEAAQTPAPAIPSNMSPADWLNLITAVTSIVSSQKRKSHEMSDSESDEPPMKKQKTESKPAFDKSSLKAQGGMNGLLMQASEKEEALKKEGKILPDNLAALINQLFTSCIKGKEAKEVCDNYPAPQNTSHLVAPVREAVVNASIEDAAESDKAVKTEFIKRQDDKLFYLQRDIVAAMSAFAEIGSLMYERKDSEEDQELDDLSGAFGDGMRLLALVVQTLSEERRNLLGRVLKPKAFQHLTATLTTRDNPEALFGGDIAEAMKDFDAARKAAKSMVKEQAK